MIFLTTLIASVLLTALTVPALSWLALRHGLVDLPNERKVHTQAIPRVGGLAMALGAFVPITYWGLGNRFVTAYLLGAAVLLLFGFLDDYHDLSPRWKLLGQGIAALIAIYGCQVRIANLGGLLPDSFLLPGWFGVPLTLLAIVGVTNAINLSDGLDGLAGGISLLCLSSISYMAYVQGNTTSALIGLALCGAIFGFLRFNTYPATIFMGDAGSQLLGYSAIVLALDLTQGNTALSPVLPLLILGFPVLDTLTVMTERIRKGRSPFSADKNHFHHTLLRLGLHHTESVLLIYLIQVALIVTAFVLRFSSEWLLLGGYLTFCGALLALFNFTTRRKEWKPQRLPLLIQIKAFLRWLREETGCIKYLFRLLEGALLGVLLLTVLLTEQLPGYVSLGALAGMTCIGGVYFYWRRYLKESLRLAIYLLFPLAVYYSSISLEIGGTELTVRLYRLLFVLLAVLALLVMKLTQRKQGFKSTPLDFLILFLALVVPNLPESNLPDYNLGMIGVKIVICYFSCEVLFAELRDKFKRVALATLLALLLLAIKGLTINF